jgi:hypothetical protein
VTAVPTQVGIHSPEATGVPLGRVGFSCRLPVVTYETGGDGISYQGGFITFPSATYTEDPNGLIIATYPSGLLATRQLPQLNGVLDEKVPFFDSAVGRWVPVVAGQSAPNGLTYAYATIGASITDGATIHVVDIRSGADKTFHWAIPGAGAPNGVQVMDYDGASVYLVVTQFEQYPQGVWRLDVGTGKVAALAQVGNVLAVRGGYAWAGGDDPHDPNPPKVAASRELFDSITQVNLSTGARIPWYYTPGRSEYLLGLATAGWPVVNISDSPDYPPYGGEIRLVPEPHVDGESNGELVSNGQVLINPQTDGDRTWFGSDNGVYLYTTSGALQKVFAFPPDPTTAKTMSPAGFCR